MLEKLKRIMRWKTAGFKFHGQSNEISNLLTVLVKKQYCVGIAIFQRKKFKWLFQTP